jgi:hypothetical protein
MAKPTSRTELKDYALRKLGFPVIEINVDDDQLDDRIDEALTMYQQFHYDAVEKTYLKHQVTQGDISNTYISMPSTVIGVTRMFPIGSDSVNSNAAGNFNMFDLTYQLRLNELYDFTSADYVYYALAKQHIRTLDLLFLGEQPIRFNRHDDKLYIDMKWDNRVVAGSYLVIECYKTLDPNVAIEVWNDGWLKKYVTALFKKQWGENLKKFSGVQLPGGITLNGQQIWNEAEQEIERLEEKLRDTYEEPPQFEIG